MIQFNWNLSMSRPRARWALVCLMMLAPLGVAAAGDRWPEFRGSNGTGLAEDATGLPISWSEKENVRWKTPIHDKGWSSPVVWDNQVWLTTATEDGKQRFVVAFMSADEAAAIKGKLLTLTLVSDEGSTETTWTAN